jgi:hypothetical protein
MILIVRNVHDPPWLPDTVLFPLLPLGDRRDVRST